MVQVTAFLGVRFPFWNEVVAKGEYKDKDKDKDKVKEIDKDKDKDTKL
jgi:hypothetical protein